MGVCVRIDVGIGWVLGVCVGVGIRICIGVCVGISVRVRARIGIVVIRICVRVDITTVCIGIAIVVSIGIGRWNSAYSIRQKNIPRATRVASIFTKIPTLASNCRLHAQSIRSNDKVIRTTQTTTAHILKAVFIITKTLSRQVESRHASLTCVNSVQQNLFFAQ